MFGDHYEEVDDQDEVHQAGEDRAGEDEAREEEAREDEAGEASDDELLPDLDMPDAAGGIFPYFRFVICSFSYSNIFFCTTLHMFFLQLYLPQGEPSKKKPRQERKIWTWSSGDLPPQDMPDNKVKSKGMEECSYPVDYFMKIFGRATFDLLLEQSNIHRLNVSFLYRCMYHIHIYI
jgi:hypothetical protein